MTAISALFPKQVNLPAHLVRGEFVRTPSDQHISPTVCPALRKVQGIVDLRPKCIDFTEASQCPAYCGYDEDLDRAGYLLIRCRGRFGQAEVTVTSNEQDEDKIDLEFQMSDPNARLHRVEPPWLAFAAILALGLLIGLLLS